MDNALIGFGVALIPLVFMLLQLAWYGWVTVTLLRIWKKVQNLPG